MAETFPQGLGLDSGSTSQDSRTTVINQAANEIVFAVVGHAGSGTSDIARALGARLGEGGLEGGPFEMKILKASDVIRNWARESGQDAPEGKTSNLSSATQMQNLGDKMRESTGDLAAVAKALICQVRETRADKTGIQLEDGVAVVPDSTRRAYILDSLRHPAEAQLLRHIYQDAFVLIGVVCEEDARLARIQKKFSNSGTDDARDFMKRDARASERHGQRVSDAFYLSDFYVDNTTNQYIDGIEGQANPHWDVNDHLSRLIRIISHAEITRPTYSETAMHEAYGAQLRSACLSRQVGAALVDRHGNVIATGTNEVPRAGGGVYGEGLKEERPEGRCALRSITGGQFCSNTQEQNDIVEELIVAIDELRSITPARQAELKAKLRETRIGQILEFSRAVHAEMDALLTAARKGVSPVGARLFVTAFPCHYCARHIVSAGVDEVQYIEPYPKSQALALHSDAIADQGSDWKPPSEDLTSKVLFRPFVGVAPGLYRRAFLKNRELKDRETGKIEVSTPEWGDLWHLRKASYVQLEADLAKSDHNG